MPRRKGPKKSELGIPPLPLDGSIEGKQRRAVAMKKIAKMISMGKNRDEVVGCLMTDYNYAEDSAQKMWCEAQRNVRARYERYCSDAARMNINRLNTIIDDAYDSNDRRSLLNAIDMLNKMASLYVDKKEVKTTGDQITVKFG